MITVERVDLENRNVVRNSSSNVSIENTTVTCLKYNESPISTEPGRPNVSHITALRFIARRSDLASPAC
ncbi:hypothetical protein J6590_028833, partial [Homalodisca vitripennis]